MAVEAKKGTAVKLFVSFAYAGVLKRFVSFDDRFFERTRGGRVDLVSVFENIDGHGGEFYTQFCGSEEDALGTGEAVVRVEDQILLGVVFHFVRFEFRYRVEV